MTPILEGHPEDNFEIKRKEYEKLCEGVPDAIYILSNVTEKTNPKTGKKYYKPDAYNDVDWNGNTYGSGKAKALVTVELSECFPEAVVAVNSKTYSINDPEAPSDAEVMAEYIARKGVDGEKIIKQDRSSTTFTELIELIKYIAKYKWRHPVIITSDLQILRAKEMLNQIETLEDPAGASTDTEFRSALVEIKNINPKITFISADRVLHLRDPRYAEIITEARKSESWKHAEKVQENAVNQLKQGLYWKNK